MLLGSWVRELPQRISEGMTGFRMEEMRKGLGEEEKKMSD